MNSPVTNVETCHVCNERIDPDSHALNPSTGERYCSGECWAVDNL